MYLRDYAKSNQYCWKPAKVTTPSKFRNHFYLVATSSPRKPVVRHWPSTFLTLQSTFWWFSWGLLARIAQSLVLSFGKPNDDDSYWLVSVITDVCGDPTLTLTEVPFCIRRCSSQQSAPPQQCNSIQLPINSPKSAPNVVTRRQHCLGQQQHVKSDAISWFWLQHNVVFSSDNINRQV